MIEHLGADTLIHGHIGSDMTDLTVRQNGTFQASAGDVLSVTISNDHLHLFDPETEKRITL